MEHNFTFNSAAEITLIHDILAPIFNDYATYQAMRSIVSFGGMAMPDFNNYADVNFRELLDRLDNAIAKAEEDENPKPEHRYLVTNDDGEIYEEFDDLKKAWDFYEQLYRDDANNGYFRDAGMYTLTDQLLDEVVTEEVPQIGVEIRFDASIDITIDGHSTDFDDLNDEVREDIGNSIGCGNTYDWLSYDLGDVAWYQIQDWEEEHEEETSGDVCWDEAVKEVNDNAEEESTEA